MTENWFFRWLWRYNALGIAVIISLTGYMLLPEFLQFRPSGFGTYTFRDLPPSGGVAVGKYRLTLDYPRPGRSVGVFALEVMAVDPAAKPKIVDTGDYTAAPFRSGRLVNYLFVPTVGDSHWLFPAHAQTIQNTLYFTDEVMRQSWAPQTPSQSPLRAVVYDVSVDGSTKHDLYIAKPDGSGLTKIVAAAEDTPAVAQLQGGEILVSYTVGGQVMTTSVAFADLKERAAQSLSPVLPK